MCKHNYNYKYKYNNPAVCKHNYKYKYKYNNQVVCTASRFILFRTLLSIRALDLSGDLEEPTFLIHFATSTIFQVASLQKKRSQTGHCNIANTIFEYVIGILALKYTRERNVNPLSIPKIWENGSVLDSLSTRMFLHQECFSIENVSLLRMFLYRECARELISD